MCKRFTPLSHNEAQDILDAFTEGKPIRLPDKDINDAKHDAFPGKTSPVFLSDGKGGLVLVEATWGFPTVDGKKLIFNTRLDTALRHLASGEGMWSKAIEQGRCLVPSRAFYENHKTDKRYSERSDKEQSDKQQMDKLQQAGKLNKQQEGKLIKQQYRISLNGAKAFFMAGVFQDGRFSIVTTTPNNTMALIHDRMPLVLGPGETSIWLGQNFAMLADRSNLRLLAKPESDSDTSEKEQDE